jgi:ribosome modulation factor
MRGLDAWITGHYGEDQFRGGRTYSSAWCAGQTARIHGKSRGSCRCKCPKTRAEWIAGWDEEDLAIRSEKSEQRFNEETG